MKYALVLATALCADVTGAQTLATKPASIIEMPEELQNSALLAAAALEEIAEQRKVGLEQAGAVLLLWDYPACDVYNALHESGDDVDMPEKKLQALQEKCIKVVHLGSAKRGEYFQTAAAAKKPNTTAISIAWMDPDAELHLVRVLAIDLYNSCFVTTPGYDEFLQGKQTFSCSPRPWNWDIATTTPGTKTP